MKENFVTFLNSKLNKVLSFATIFFKIIQTYFYNIYNFCEIIFLEFFVYVCFFYEMIFF